MAAMPKPAEDDHAPQDSAPKPSDALLDSMARQARVSAMGFDWPDIHGVLDKIGEELEEIRGALQMDRADLAARELGDLLLAAVNASRFLGADPSEALRGATGRLCARVEKAAALLRKEGLEPATCTAGEIDATWRAVKSLEDKGLKNRP